ncbi:MAG: SIR2 family protein [Spirochaetia bacterium]|nr:SIR2 family protein [Spirochaetia bacterium]
MFNNYFVGVELPENRKKFLNNNWPYIYTLNIDDGIENSLKNYEKIMPYKNLNIDYVKTNKCIFKLHGDAKHEIFYKNDENFVLSRKQYLISIRDNYDLLQFIQSDYKSKNILLVGCSLEDEIDLEYAVATNDGFDEAKNNRYFLSEKVPDEDLQEKLEELFVNKIILVERYEDFYQDFFVGSEKKETILSKYRFTGYLSNNDKEDNIDYFLGMQNQKKDGKVIKYESMAERDVEILKINDVFKNNTILVVGPRLSGKTTFLVNMLQKLSSH